VSGQWAPISAQARAIGLDALADALQEVEVAQEQLEYVAVLVAPDDDDLDDPVYRDD